MSKSQKIIVLCVVASSVRKQIRKTDIFARLGGDEFALLLPETDEVSACVAISKIQAALLIQTQQNNWPVTSSIGVLTCNLAPFTAEELIKKADDLMYAAKKDGKNRIKNRIKYASYSKKQ